MADTTGTRLWRNFECTVTNSKVTFNLNIDPQICAMPKWGTCAHRYANLRAVT